MNYAKETIKYYINLFILTFNAIFHFIVSNRNYGKTWSFKIRAWRRAYKRGKKTLWVRRFRKEQRSASATFYSSADLQKQLKGFEEYNPGTKKGNFKQLGHTLYIKRNGKWDWFIKIVCLSDSNAMRSADDVNCDTIVFDEFTTTPERYKRYRGNEVTDFIDAFFSAKREHKIQAFFLGNKESVTNPYFDYFGITPLPDSFEGIRRYRKGSIIVHQINNVASKEGDYNNKVYELFKGTSYGAYIYENETKNKQKVKLGKAPKDNYLYCQIVFNHKPLRILSSGNMYYIDDKLDNTQNIFSLPLTNNYTREHTLIRAYKKNFTALVNAIADNHVRYNSYATHEACTDFFKRLSIY